MTDDRDFASYVVVRWTPLVRSLVALGAPLARAHRLAEQALSSGHDDWDDRDMWADVDVHVVGELLDRFDRDRDAWWEEPVPVSDAEELTESGWPQLEAKLDQMTVPDRQALVLRAVAGLSEEQVSELTGADGLRSDAPPADEVRDALERVPVEPPRVESMIAASARRTRRRRGVSLAGVVGLLVVAGAVTALALRDSGPDTELSPVPSVRYDNPSPVAWYAAGTLYLPHSHVPLPDVVEFAQWDDGAVYLDIRGNLVAVTAAGARQRIASPGPDATFAVSGSADTVAWVEPDRSEVVLGDLDSGQRLEATPLPAARSRIVSADGRGALLIAEGEAFEIDLTDGSMAPTVDPRLPGELDRHGQLVLAREAGGGPAARIRLHDTSTAVPLQLPLPTQETRSVRAARFAPDGSVMLLIELSGSRAAQIRRCTPPYDHCRLVTVFPTGGARSLLAK